MTKKHTHWLFGKGENKELDFNQHIEIETDCSKCIHKKVCARAVEQRCVNYAFGCSSERGCHACLHHYTRWDKDSVPCFKCDDFEAEK